MQLEPRAIDAYLSQLRGKPVSILKMQSLGGGNQGADALKAFGYGKPLLVEFTGGAAGDQIEQIVLRQIARNGFGRERDDDRMGEVWLNYTTFNELPQHISALDLVAVSKEQTLASWGHVTELLLVTDYVPGTQYADDLMRISQQGVCDELDVWRAEALASYLAEIHRQRHDDRLLWNRRLRDLVGHGEGIMGLTDSYPADFPLASRETLRAIEESANHWRWKLKEYPQRLAQVHGDFHPFNVIFADDVTFHLLDRSRGIWGEPADDVSCMTINYLFFSLQVYGKLAGPFEKLYRAFWQRYLAERPDPEMARVIQPWYAWRVLVLASPQWYPTLSDEARRSLFTFAQRLLNEETFLWQEINSYLQT